MIKSGKLDCSHNSKATLGALLKQPDYAGSDFQDLEENGKFQSVLFEYLTRFAAASLRGLGTIIHVTNKLALSFCYLEVFR